MNRPVVTMPLAIVLAFVFASIPTVAQTPVAAKKAPAKAYTPARTPWGDPDLAGVYTNKDENGIPVERPSQFDGKKIEDVEDSEFAEIVRARNEASVARAPGIGGADTGAGPVHWYEHYDARNSRPWLITILPTAGFRRPRPRRGSGPRHGLQRAPVAVQRIRTRNRSLYDQCITRGLPGSMMPAIYGNSYQIHQGPGFVAIRYEMIHETRIIPLDQSAHIGSKIKSYMGDARGRWDGSTLVVETTNFLPEAANRGASEKLRLIERFKPVGPNRVEWSVTFDDAATWNRPWTFSMNLTKDATQAPFEYACHEGNYGLRNILSAARTEEKAATAGR